MGFDRWVRTIPLRLRSLVRRQRVERELDDELRYHVETQTEILVSGGMPPERARREAMRRIGGVEQRKEECRDVRGVSLVENLVRDTRHASRALRRDWRFTIGTVSILALAIGANVAMFSIVNAILLRPLPYAKSDRLVIVRELVPQVGERTHSANERHFLEWRRCGCFGDLALSNTFSEVNLTGLGEPERVPMARVTPNVFSLLGVDASLGRTFLPQEGAAGEDAIAVISDGLWRRRFGGRRDVVGSTIALDGVETLIVGVLPPGFRHYDRGGVAPEGDVDVYLPWRVSPGEYVGWAGNFNFAALGRLHDGVSLEAALGELNVMQATIADRFEERWRGFNLQARLIPLREQLTGASRGGLLLLLAAVGTAFLVACLNIANLMLVRAITRGREAGLRAALGASRTAIFRGVLIESGLLAVGGAGLGVGLAAAFLQAFVAIAPAELPRADEVGVDVTVLLVGVGLAVMATLAFGLWPAIRMMRADPQVALRIHSRSFTDTRGRLRQALVSLEVGLSASLLVVAGLLLASFVRLERVDRGFDAANVLTAKVSLPAARYPSPGRYGAAADARLRFWSALVERLEAVPTVEAAGVTTRLPLRGNNWGEGAVPVGGQPRDEEPVIQYRWASPSYFRAMGIPLMAGRIFAGPDRPRLVAVLSERAADYLFPEDSAVGRQFHRNNPERPYEIVGVVADVHTEDPANDPAAHVYLPLWLPGSPVTAVAVRTSGDASAAAGILRDAVASLDRELAVSDVQTMTQIDRAAVGERRFQMVLTMAFAVASLLVAALGTYSVLAYGVARRTQEIAVRIALGARRAAVTAMVLRDGLRPVLLGLGLGLVAALAMGRLVSSLLFEVAPNDPPTLLAVATVTLGAAVLACWVPARRAARTSPAETLRPD